MKKISLYLVFLIMVNACGRMVKLPEEKRTIRKIYTINLSHDLIFDRALEWFAGRFTRINDAVVVRDRKRGRIIAKGSGVYHEYFNMLVARRFSYTMTCEVKEKRYRITFNNLTVYYDDREREASLARFSYEIKKISRVLTKIMEDLNRTITINEGGTNTKRGDDW